MTACRANGCDHEIGPENRSTENPYFCCDCGDLVYAMRPNRDLPNEWFLVQRGAPPVPGDRVSANQCDGCGLNEFTVIAKSRYDFVAVCAGQMYDGDWKPGCGTEHPIRQKMGKDVIW